MTAFVAGELVNVSKVCGEEWVTRKTFYKWAARDRDCGLVGLRDDRGGRCHPRRWMPGWVEEMVVAVREELALAGLDHGAITLGWHLEQRQMLAGVRVPSVATIHRIWFVGVRRPNRKRLKGLWRCFEVILNEWWRSMQWTG